MTMLVIDQTTISSLIDPDSSYPDALALGRVESCDFGLSGNVVVIGKDNSKTALKCKSVAAAGWLFEQICASLHVGAPLYFVERYSGE